MTRTAVISQKRESKRLKRRGGGGGAELARTTRETLCTNGFVSQRKNGFFSSDSHVSTTKTAPARTARIPAFRAGLGRKVSAHSVRITQVLLTKTHRDGEMYKRKLQDERGGWKMFITSGLLCRISVCPELCSVTSLHLQNACRPQNSSPFAWCCNN